MLYPFSALLARMKYITRWSLMHSTRAESLSEHTSRYRPAGPHALPDRTAVHRHALPPQNGSSGGAVPRRAGDHYRRHAHTGQVQQPHPAGCLQGVGNRERALHDRPSAGRVERRAVPVHLRGTAHRRGKAPAEGRRPAERLIKCMEEQRSGNHEFDAALAQQKAALQAMHCPEADWFIEHCLPCYTQNLDELTRQQ